MKKLNLFFVIAALSLMYSCNVEEPIVYNSDKQQVADEFTRGLREGIEKNANNFVLFEYDTESEAIKEYTDVLTQFTQTASNDISAVNNATDIVRKIRIGDGKAIISEYHYIDKGRKTVLQSFVLNEQIGQYEDVTNTFPPLLLQDVINNLCPSGMSSLGTCSYGNEVAHCIGQTMGSFMSGHMSAGNKQNFTVTCGLYGVYICGSR